MPTLAPFELWIDGAPIASAIRANGTVTITTQSEHGIVSGTYVQLGGFTGNVGSSISGVYPITVTSGSAFTVVSAGTAGTAVASADARLAEFFSFDLMSPLANYSTAARPSALYVELDSLQLSASGDGEPATINFRVLQDVTPTKPWFLCVPDQTRIRLAKTTTGSAPASGETFFRGFVVNLSTSINASGQGTETDVSGLDVTALLDRVIVYGTIR